MRFTLAIPAFNEAPVVGATLATLAEAFRRDAHIDWEIIVADNGSTDGTAQGVARLSDDRIRVITLSERGKGNAVRAAMGVATGEIVGFTDADLPVSPEAIIAAAKLVMSGEADVVAGSRLLPQSAREDREWWRTVSSRLFNILARSIVRTGVSDSQCPLKVMNAKGRAVLLATKEPTWFFDLEFFRLLRQSEYSVEEVPVAWNEHRYPDRKSKLTLGDTMRAIVAMWRIRQRYPDS